MIKNEISKVPVINFCKTINF